MAEAQKYGFDMMRSVMEASRQPSTVPAPAPEPLFREQATAKDADAGEHEPKEDVPGDKKSRLRVSEAFRQAMKQAAIAMTSENANNFSAAAVYGRMQKIDSGLAAPFNPSDMSHGKRELQGDLHKLEFMDGSYKLTEECLAQLGKSASPIGDLSKGDSVKKRGKAK